MLDPRRIRFVDRAERLRERVDQHDRLLVALVRGDQLRALRALDIRQRRRDEVGLRLLRPRPHDDATPQEVARAELRERLLRGVARRDVADHPDRVVVGFLDVGERLQRFAHVVAGVIPILDRVDGESHAEQRRQQLPRVVELIGELLFPVRQRAHARVGVDVHVERARITGLRMRGLERRGQTPRHVCLGALDFRRAAAACNQEARGYDQPGHPRTFL